MTGGPPVEVEHADPNGADLKGDRKQRADPRGSRAGSEGRRLPGALVARIVDVRNQHGASRGERLNTWPSSELELKLLDLRGCVVTCGDGSEVPGRRHQRYPGTINGQQLGAGE